MARFVRSRAAWKAGSVALAHADKIHLFEGRSKARQPMRKTNVLVCAGAEPQSTMTYSHCSFLSLKGELSILFVQFIFYPASSTFLAHEIKSWSSIAYNLPASLAV
jgi:hypothetical protein